ncbi:hypothetical protein [Solicola sp. PLA-1-18]|uniref:hypothetical protein n=1 Tax=Solicola sp. PLA-1-18 TaxID=3380532 RepID=UPI003B7CAEB5
MTATGRVSVLEGDGFHQEHVGGWRPETADEMALMEREGVGGWLSKPSEEDVPPHWRWIIHCHMPTCSYEVPLVVSEDGDARAVSDLLRAMVDLKVDHLAVEFNEMFRMVAERKWTARQFVAAHGGT